VLIDLETRSGVMENRRRIGVVTGSVPAEIIAYKNKTIRKIAIPKIYFENLEHVLLSLRVITMPTSSDPVVDSIFRAKIDIDYTFFNVTERLGMKRTSNRIQFNET